MSMSQGRRLICHIKYLSDTRPILTRSVVTRHRLELLMNLKTCVPNN